MRTVAALVLAATLAAITGCSAAEAPPPAPSPSPTATPVFASDEEALAAAEEAYREYLAMSDQIAADGGQRPERIRDYVAPDRLDAELAAFEAYKVKGLRARGATRFEPRGLQQYSGDLATGATVVIYGCWDATEVVVQTLDGGEATPQDRQERLSLEVSLVSADQDPDRLVLLEEAPWSGDPFC